MNLIKILSKIGLVKITKHNYYDQHIFDYQLRQPIPPNKPSPRDDPSRTGTIGVVDPRYNRGLPPSKYYGDIY